jgi:hypothetical protein
MSHSQTLSAPRFPRLATPTVSGSKRLVSLQAGANEGLLPSNEYARRPARLPARNLATIKLTHYPRPRSGTEQLEQILFSLARGIDDAGRRHGRPHEFGDGALRFEDGAFSRVAGAAPGSVSVEVRGPPVTCWIGRADNLVMRAAVL